MRLFVLNSYYKQISVRQVIKKGLKTKISMFVAETPLKCRFSKGIYIKILISQCNSGSQSRGYTRDLHMYIYILPS